MERKTIERKNGQMSKPLEGMAEFAEMVAKELCEKYPDVDFFDLEFMFKREFNHQMSLQVLKYSYFQRIPEQTEDS